MKTAEHLKNDLIEALKKGIADPTGKALNDAFLSAAVPAGKLRGPTALGSTLFLKDIAYLNELYGPFAQALRGNNPNPVSSFTDGPVAREKTQAWNGMKDKTVREAQIEYICLVIQIAIDFKDSKALKNFCKDIYSKKEKYDAALRDVFYRPADAKLMAKRRADLEKSPDPAKDKSNIVTSLTEKTKERLKLFGINLSDVYTETAVKSRAAIFEIDSKVPAEQIQKIASESPKKLEIAKRSEATHGMAGTEASSSTYLPGFAATRASERGTGFSSLEYLSRDSKGSESQLAVESADVSPEIMILADGKSSMSILSSGTLSGSTASRLV